MKLTASMVIGRSLAAVVAFIIAGQVASLAVQSGVLEALWVSAILAAVGGGAVAFNISHISHGGEN